MTSSPDSPQPAAEGHQRRISARQVIGLVFIVLFIVFLLENTAKVQIRFVGPRVHAPLYLALIIAAVLGALAMLFIQHRRNRR